MYIRQKQQLYRKQNTYKYLYITYIYIFEPKEYRPEDEPLKFNRLAFGISIACKTTFRQDAQDI